MTLKEGLRAPSLLGALGEVLSNATDTDERIHLETFAISQPCLGSSAAGLRLGRDTGGVRLGAEGGASDAIRALSVGPTCGAWSRATRLSP